MFKSWLNYKKKTHECKYKLQLYLKLGCGFCILQIPVEDPKKLYAIKVDITKEEEILDGFQWIKENLGPVSILVNNAGIIPNSDLSDGSTESWKRTIDINVLGLCIATREVLKQMKENGITGHIIHINSIAGHGLVIFE